MMTRTVMWPFASLALIVLATRKYGSHVRNRHSIGIAAQVWRQYLLANLYNIPPEAYYQYRLFDARSASEPAQVIQRPEVYAIFEHLHRGTDRAVLDDKRAFRERCVTHNLPVTPLVAAFSKGEVTHWEGGRPGQFPRVDLFMKPANLYRGIGAELWCFDSSSETWHRNGVYLSASEMFRHCRGKSANRDLLVERRVVNHPELAKLALEGLCTVRIVTHRFPNALPELLLASLRMPRGNSHTDNLAAGGLASPVAPQTGELGLAVGYDLRGGEWKYHPDTKWPIAGSVIPYWREALQLVETAHRVFAEFAFVGWDVAISPSGPLIVEANAPFGVRVLQIPHRKPLGQTPFVACCLAHCGEAVKCAVPDTLEGKGQQLDSV